MFTWIITSLYAKIFNLDCNYILLKKVIWGMRELNYCFYFLFLFIDSIGLSFFDISNLVLGNYFSSALKLFLFLNWLFVVNYNRRHLQIGSWMIFNYLTNKLKLFVSWFLFKLLTLRLTRTIWYCFLRCFELSWLLLTN